tara:strand:+ start:93 stop:353 length:261 start_codon:yes stop_codon:yes gene_type:complete
MPKLYNTVMKKFMWMPDHYTGQFPFETEEEAAVKGIVDTEVVEAPKPAETPKVVYNPDAVDGDGDGLVQDGTEFQRPVDTKKKRKN